MADAASAPATAPPPTRRWRPHSEALDARTTWSSNCELSTRTALRTDARSAWSVPVTIVFRNGSSSSVRSARGATRKILVARWGTLSWKAWAWWFLRRLCSRHRLRERAGDGRSLADDAGELHAAAQRV